MESKYPSAIEAEEVILGSILLNSDAFYIVDEQLQPEDFYSFKARAIFTAMKTLTSNLQEIDPVLLLETLRKANIKIDSTAEILSLIHGLPLNLNLQKYITLVKNKSKARKLINSCEKITQKALSDQLEIEDLTNYAETELLNTTNDDQSADLQSITSWFQKSVDKKQQIALNGDQLLGIPTGFTELDSRLKGLKKGELLIVAARPSMGKTAFSVNIAQHAAFREDKLVAMFSIEMSEEELVDRIIPSELGIESSRYKLGLLNEEEWGNVEQLKTQLSHSQFFIDDSPRINPGSMRSKLRRLQKKVGRKVDLVIVDYLQLMTLEDRPSRVQEITDLSRTMKIMAREFECPWIVLSQTNREPERRSNHRPSLADLRESGSIEQDADVVMFIYREDVYSHDPTFHTHESEIIIAKQRNGPIGTVRLRYDESLVSFFNIVDGIGDDF